MLCNYALSLRCNFEHPASTQHRAGRTQLRPWAASAQLLQLPNSRRFSILRITMNREMELHGPTLPFQEQPAAFLRATETAAAPSCHATAARCFVFNFTEPIISSFLQQATGVIMHTDRFTQFGRTSSISYDKNLNLYYLFGSANQ
jgi:hypothetical protein